MSRWTGIGRFVLGMVFAASSCLAQVKPVTMRVDVNNFVLYNYDTFDAGLFGGPPAPGAPAAVARSNMIVTGGTGAFLGVRGQAGQAGPWTPRVASVTEDPANRRINGGGTQSIILQLFPNFPPASTR